MTLPAEREGHAPPEKLAQARAALAGAAAGGYFVTDPPAEEIAPGGVRALRFRPAGASRGTVVHFHGGGFRQGQPEMSSTFARALADVAQVEVVCPAYRLAPEHPFPAGVNDGLAVVAALTGEAAGPIILSGDSAGGGIAASLVAAGIRPAGLILLSAWLDLRVTLQSYDSNAAGDALFSRASAEEAAALYLQGHDAADTAASPLLAVSEVFPSTFVNVGAEEVLLDDSLAFHAALESAGVSAQLMVVPGMSHVAVTRSFDLPGARETFDAVAAFVDGVCGLPV